MICKYKFISFSNIIVSKHCADNIYIDNLFVSKSYILINCNSQISILSRNDTLHSIS